MFIGQTVENEEKHDKVMAFKTFGRGLSVTSETVFTTVIELCGNYLEKIYSLMSDTTALNTGKKTGINKRLANFYKKHSSHGIHSLECLFHVNELYLTHAISTIEGKTKGPGAMEDGALMNLFNAIQKPDLMQMLDQNQINIPVTSFASTK